MKSEPVAAAHIVEVQTSAADDDDDEVEGGIHGAAAAGGASPSSSSAAAGSGEKHCSFVLFIHETNETIYLPPIGCYCAPVQLTTNP